MRVTVTEVPNRADALEDWWSELVRHVRDQRSETVILPEMPFGEWPAASSTFDPKTWQRFCREHGEWMQRLTDLPDAAVLGSCPVNDGTTRHNEAFLWTRSSGHRAAHRKYYLPDEPGFYEATWYQRGAKEFAVTRGPGFIVGFLLCTELWFSEHARAYGRAGAHIVACPRATGLASLDKWIAGGRAAAVASGAYCVSANRGGVDADGFAWAGGGWIIEPEEGNVLAVTTPRDPFATVDLDLAVAKRAKATYPRYIKE